MREQKSCTAENDKRIYYKPKIDKSRSVLLDDIEKYNHDLKSRNFRRKYLSSPAEKILAEPSHYLIQAVTDDQEEEAIEAKRLLDNGKVIEIVSQNMADRACVKQIFQDTIAMDNTIKAASIFIKDNLTQAGSIFRNIEDYSLIDPEKVTYGDLKMFQYHTKNMEAAIEELLQIREKTNARCGNGGKIDYNKLGRNSRLKKMVDKLVDISEI